MPKIDELNLLLEKAISSQIEETELSYSDRRLMAQYRIKSKEYLKLVARAENGRLGDLSHTDFDEYCYTKLELENEILRIEKDLESRLYTKQKLQHEFIATLEKTKNMFLNKASYLEGQIIGKAVGEKIARIKKAKFAADKKHEATNKAKEEIKKIWASGKYTSRDICAEQECSELNLSFSTARKALRNTPNHH